MQGSSISEITQNILGFFNKSTLQIGKMVKFVKRKDQAKLDAKVFATALIKNCLLGDQVLTLEQMRSHIKDCGIKISKSGLHQRFNETATHLMEKCLSQALKRFKGQKQNVIKLLRPFSEVILLDSSGISLPESMKTFYQGCGGDASQAALKIQTLFNYIDGHIEEITFTDGRKNDQGFKEHLDRIKAGALYLQDLGYFSVKSFARLHDEKAYFISRYFANTALYDGENNEINLLRLLKSRKNFFSIDVKLGQEKVPVKLIAQRLPEAKVEQRIRRLRAEAKKRGREPRKDTLELAKWSVCITNIPKKTLSAEHVYLVYSLRWQIELFFKLIKQEAGVDKIKSKKTPRVLCEIYAKLICIAMLLYLCFTVRWKAQREVSFPKAYQHLRKRTVEFFNAIASPHRFTQFLTRFWDDIQDFAMKDIKQKKPATYQKLMKASGYEAFV